MSWNDVWPELRQGMIHGFSLCGITLEVDPPKTAVLLERLGTAVDDLDTGQLSVAGA